MVLAGRTAGAAHAYATRQRERNAALPDAPLIRSVSISKIGRRAAVLPDAEHRDGVVAKTDLSMRQVHRAGEKVVRSVILLSSVPAAEKLAFGR
jgi:hypothetical protein